MVNYRYLVCNVVLEALYRGIRVLSRVDSRVQNELSRLPQGQIIRIRVSSAEDAPQLTFSVAKDSICKTAKSAPPQVDIVFKNPKMAFRVFTGRMSIAGAYGAHAFTLRGSIPDTMAIVRILELVEGYLFPKCMARHLLKELPEKEYPTALVYLRLIPGC